MPSPQGSPRRGRPSSAAGTPFSEPLRTRAEDRVRGNVGWHKRIARRVVVAAEGGYALARDARDARGDARGGPCRVTARAPGVRPEEARVAGARARQGRRHRRALRAAGAMRAQLREAEQAAGSPAPVSSTPLEPRTSTMPHKRTGPPRPRRPSLGEALGRRPRREAPREKKTAEGERQGARRSRRRTRSRFRRAFFWVRARTA